MRELFAEMQGLRGALASADAAAAATHGRAIAVACDDQEVHDLDPARFGPRFGEIDRELHVAAAELAAAAEAGDLVAARERYTRTLAACSSCHAQAPSAGHVDLAPLAP